MPSAEVDISFYNFLNPHRPSDIDIELEDRAAKFDLEPVDDSYWKTYRLKIPDTTEFGFVRWQKCDQPIQDLISAINLHIVSGAATRRITRIDKCSIDYTVKDKEKYDLGTGAEIVPGTITQPISEEIVFDIYEKIRELDRRSIEAPPDLTIVSEEASRPETPQSIEVWLGNLSTDDIDLRGVNLRKALLAYDGAMDADHKAIQHLLLFIALEAATDAWGEDVRGSNLEDAISDVSDVDVSYIKHWRDIYHRQKHPDFEEEQLEMSIAALTSRGINTHSLRKATIRSIMSRLYD